MTTELAPAKVNLTLHVTGLRADGYHLLDSMVVFTAVGDVLALSDAPGLTLTGPEAAGLRAEPDNLVLRAARLIGAGDAGVVLDKRLPIASGIGGGSSDAAATLRLLSRVRGLSLPDAAATLALGADVPVCMTPRPTRMQGVGEVLSDIPPLPPLWMVLVNPRQGVSTPAVFRGLTRRDGAPMVLPDAWRDLSEFAEWLAQQRNDLEAPAASLCPDIGVVLAALRARPDCALARMSGSGATCFGLFASQSSAELAARALQSAQPAWWVRATALLGAA